MLNKLEEQEPGKRVNVDGSNPENPAILHGRYTNVDDIPDERVAEELARIITLTKEKETRSKLIRMFRLVFAGDATALESKMLNRFDVEWLFDEIISIEKGNFVDDQNFQFDYGNLLLKFVDFKVTFHERVKLALTEFVRELTNKNIPLNTSLVQMIWKVCERHILLWTDLIRLILPSSKPFIEEKVFEWLYNRSKSKEKCCEYYIEISYHCEELFSMIVRILNQFVVMSEGNEEILNFIQYFVTLLHNRCNNDKTIFSFYPRDYVRLISLLVIPPEMYPNQPSKSTVVVPSKVDVLGLLHRKFEEDHDLVLLVLTHFPQWLGRFADFLKLLQGTATS